VAAFTPDGKLDASVPTGVDTFDEKYLNGFVWSLEDGGTLLKSIRGRKKPSRPSQSGEMPAGPSAGAQSGSPMRTNRR
jgi:hypothetical protein